MVEILQRAQIRSFRPADPVEVTVDEVIDLELGSVTSDENPFDYEGHVTLRGPGSALISVPVFFDPARGHVVRVSFPSAGSWTVTDLTEASRAVDVGPGTGRAHGAPAVDPAFPRHLVFRDGTHWFPRGYEVDWLFMIDQRDAQLTRVNEFLDSIAGAGFNFVTANVYARSFRQYVPVDLEADPRWVLPDLAPWAGGNERPDYASLDPEFFAHMDAVMLELQARGIIVNLMVHVYNKDVNWPEFASADDDRYWRYVIARYQAFTNVIWDTAKESYYRDASYIWSRIALFRRYDGYGRLVTAHDANIPLRNHDWGDHGTTYGDPSKELTDALVDVTSDQILWDIHQDALEHYTRFAKPYFNVEFGYETGIDDLPSDHSDHDQDWREVIRRHWQVVMGGAYPNYYYRNTAWSLFIPFPEPPGYAGIRVLADFWDGLEFWKLDPADHLVRAGHAYVRADPGNEYVMYAEAGGTIRLDVVHGRYEIVWMDAFTGETLGREEREVSEFVLLEAPTSDGAVARITSCC